MRDFSCPSASVFLDKVFWYLLYILNYSMERSNQQRSISVLGIITLIISFLKNGRLSRS